MRRILPFRYSLGTTRFLSDAPCLAPVDARPDARADESAAKRSDRAAKARAEAPSPESRDMQLWQLNQKQIDVLLDGADSDGHMLGIFLMSNDIDLSFARAAYTRTERQDVRAFAKRMITDHTQMVASLRSLIEDGDLVPADNMLGRDLRDLASVQRDSLLVRQGLAFDRGYVAWAIDNHRELLSLIDDVILPRTEDGRLREMVATMRPIISAHLAHAEQLQASLGGR